MCTVSSRDGRFCIEARRGLFINASGLHEAKPYQMEQAVVYCVNVDPIVMGT